MATAIDALRIATSLLALYDPDEGDESIEANKRKALRLTAQMRTLVAALDHLRKGAEPVALKPGLSTAGNFLDQLTGKVPSAPETHALGVALVFHADHELSAFTFAAHVAVATPTDIYSAVISAVISAVGTLAGPPHGGANVNVMHLLAQIGTPDRTEEAVGQMLADGKKTPGIGHWVCRTLNPRAVSLREMSRQLAESSGDSKWY